MKLKDYIQKNKQEFDTEQMSSASHLAFEKLLKKKLHQPKKQKVIYLKIISVAACLAIVFTTFLWMNNKEKSTLQKQELLANLEADSAGKRLEGVYAFNDDFVKEDNKIITTLIGILHKDENANVKIATIDALIKFPKNEKIRTNLITALQKEKVPLVQIKLIKALTFLRENRAQKSLEEIINNEETYPIVKSNATLAMVEIKKQ